MGEEEAGQELVMRMKGSVRTGWEQGEESEKLVGSHEAGEDKRVMKD